ncbi:MAG: AMP-binding protein, partial [Thermomicrobiales bacterium]
MTDEIVWRPDAAAIERSRLLAFCRAAGVVDPDALQQRAAEDPGWYWDQAVRHLGYRFSTPYSSPLDLSGGKPWPRWFVDGGFNWVDNALDRWIDAGHGSRTALIWEGDDGATRTLTWNDLAAETSRFAAALHGLGVRKGDRVGVFLPMLAETAIAMLAIGRLGAIFLPMFSGFGAEAIASRLRDGEATMLICADGARRRGQIIPMKQTADEAAALAPSIEKLVVLRHTGAEIPWREGRDIWWHDAVAAAPPGFTPEPTAADDPYMVIYTSGTTGKPKGALHVQSGFPIKAAHDLAMCFDLGPGDTLFWLTDLGWMMGPWLIGGGLMNGAAIVLFEG